MRIRLNIKGKGSVGGVWSIRADGKRERIPFKNDKTQENDMNKLRADSNWSRLNREQLARLEGWLFDDNLDYAEVLVRAEKELGVAASLSSLKRYRRRVAQKQMLLELKEGISFARSSKKARKARIHTHAMTARLAGMKAMELALCERGQERQFLAFVRMLMKDQTAEIDKQRLDLWRDELIFAGKLNAKLK
jgi:hypothetical protein